MGRHFALSLILIFLLFFLPWLWGEPTRAVQEEPPAGDTEPDGEEEPPEAPPEEPSAAASIDKNRKLNILAGGQLRQTDMESYLMGVVRAEMPAAFELEALKAQAVAARTYTLHKMQNGGSANHPEADACDDITCCQAYLSQEEAAQNWGDQAPAWEEKVRAAVTGTDLYRNVGRMLRTGALPTLLTLGAYLVLSQLHPLSQVDGAVLSALSDRFVLSWWTLLPAAVMFLLPLLKVPIQWTILISSGLSAVIAALVQGFSPAEILSAAWGGYRPEDPALAAVLSGGGVTSMASSYVIVVLTGLYSGLLEGTGALTPLSVRARALADRTGRFPAMIAVSVLCAAVLCNQAVTSMMGAQLLESAYDDREELAMDIENSGILIAGLIPWSIACSIPLAMLGAGNGAILYAFLLWLIPICYLGTKKKFYPQNGHPSSPPPSRGGKKKRGEP